MRVLIQLLTSPYAVARVLLTGVAALLTSQAGNWFDNRLFGELSVFYGASYGIAIFTKGGGDSALTRALSAAGDRSGPLLGYLSSSLFRWLMALMAAAVIFPVFLGFSGIEVVAASALSAVIVTGNALRISLSPNFQLGYDNSTVTVIAVFLAIVFGTPVWLAGLGLAITLGTLQAVALKKAKSNAFVVSSPRNFFSCAYMASEISYFLLGFAAPGLMLMTAELNEVGAIRSVERLVFVSTFALFVVNNRLFNDFSLNQGSIGTLGPYLRRYSAPSAIFYLVMLILIASLAALGLVPNIAAQPEAFALYGLAYLVSVSCGPVSGALNFLGDERFVLISGLLGAAVLLAFLPFAIAHQSPIALVIGSATGLIVINLTQFLRLTRRLIQK